MNLVTVLKGLYGAKEDLGLYAAQRFLRHASPATTAAHYFDKRTRVTPGLGRLLNARVENVVSFPEVANSDAPGAGQAS